MKHQPLLRKRVLFLFVGLLATTCFLLFNPLNSSGAPQAQVTGNTAYVVQGAKSSPNANPLKNRSGIHLGNRGKDWDNPRDFLYRLKGDANGNRPTAVVVLSGQIFDIKRSTTTPCNITHAIVKRSVAYQYLTQAIVKGTYVIIRLYPSPGNFDDYNAPGASHDLLAGPNPAGSNYCNGNENSFRSSRDLAQEMKAIYDLNTQNQWPIDRFFFEPANEPNLEWYASKPGVVPNADNSLAWHAMNNYFVAVYNEAKALNQSIKVLTPPMSQSQYAEEKTFGSCLPSSVVGGGSGYDWMILTYSHKNDGYSWHNYWRQGKEFWSNSFCSGGPTQTQTSDHVYQYFPAWLRDTITSANDQGTKLSFITEADLLSPCVAPSHAVTNKDLQASATQESVWRFINEDRGARIVVAWLLTVEWSDSPGCSSGNNEQAWHEAVKEDGERSWYTQWWARID